MDTPTLLPSVRDEHGQLKLVRLEVQNFLRIEALTIPAQGNHVEITGPNGAGKTSAVDALWSALAGAKAPKLEKPIHAGAKRADVRADLGEIVVTKTYTPGGPRLVVTAADGTEIRKPQQLLDSLLGGYSLDPVAFVQQRPRDQLDDILAVCGIQPPAAQVQEITRERQDPRPGESAAAYLERLSADETGLYYVRRRDAHRDVQQKDAALLEQQEKLQQMGGPVKGDEAVGDDAALLERLHSLDAVEERRRSAQQAADAEAQNLREGLRRLEARRETVESRRVAVEAARRALEFAQQQLAEAEALLAKGTAAVEDMRQYAAEAEEAVKAVPDTRAEREELHQKIRAIREEGKSRTERKLWQQLIGSTAKGAEAARAEHLRLDHVLRKLRELRAELLAGIDLGVPGLAVGDEGLTLNGIPFAQASLAQRIRVACAVAMRQKPRLRLLRLDNAEHLDSESRELVYQLADANGWQVVMTRVADGNGLRVEIVEGGQA